MLMVKDPFGAEITITVCKPESTEPTEPRTEPTEPRTEPRKPRTE